MATGQLLVKVGNPKALDAAVQQFGAVVVQSRDDVSGYERDGDGFVVACYRDIDFVDFAITHQGYGTVLGRRGDQDEAWLRK